MKYFEGVQLLEAPQNMDNDSPYIVFLEVLLLLFLLRNLVVEVSLISEFHYDAALAHSVPQAFAFQEGLLVAHDVMMPNRGEDAHLV